MTCSSRRRGGRGGTKMVQHKPCVVSTSDATIHVYTKRQICTTSGLFFYERNVANMREYGEHSTGLLQLYPTIYQNVKTPTKNGEWVIQTNVKSLKKNREVLIGKFVASHHSKPPDPFTKNIRVTQTLFSSKDQPQQYARIFLL